MERRALGRTGLEVGVIGLGTEHLVRDRAAMEAVLRTAVEAGVSYVDLLYPDPTGSDREFWEAFGPPLRLHREKLVLAAHWGSGPRDDLPYCLRCFEDLLAELGNGRAEIALMTMVDSEAKWTGWAQASLEHLHRHKAQGHIDYIGLSSHYASIALQAVQSGSIDVLMFPINLLSHDDQEVQALIQACVTQETGLVAMKAYHGGALFTVNGHPSGITPAQCLAYVLSLPVATTVPGPKTVDELQATLHYLEATDQEKDFRRLLGTLREVLAGQCVYCHHCLPCPEGIEIGWTIWLVDQAQGGVTEELRGFYGGFAAPASTCTECGACLERCPFEVDILAKLRQAVEVFEEGVA